MAQPVIGRSVRIPYPPSEGNIFSSSCPACGRRLPYFLSVGDHLKFIILWFRN